MDETETCSEGLEAVEEGVPCAILVELDALCGGGENGARSGAGEGVGAAVEFGRGCDGGGPWTDVGGG